MLVLTLFTFPSGCGSGTGRGPDGEVGVYTSDAGSFVPGSDTAGSAALDAHIEDDHVAVRVVTLGCAGDCADVEAVASGGVPPYSFVWEDGSTIASRHVCPTSSTAYRVTVTDTGTSGEFAQTPETVQVPLTANVLACPDGGDAPDADAASDAETGPPANCVTITGGDAAAAAGCASPVGAQNVLRVPFPPLTPGQEYNMNFATDLTATSGISAQLNYYFSNGSCDRSGTGGTVTSSAAVNGRPEFGGFGQCFDGATTELLIDFVPGLGGSGYDLSTWSVQICPGCGG